MIKLQGYQIIEELYKHYSSTIFRAKRNSDDESVIIKLLNKEYPTEEELSFFEHEYEISTNFSSDGVIKVYTLENYKKSLAIVMEDIDGISVSKAIKSLKLSLSDKINLAIKITDALSQIHEKNIIHKDINPMNIIWNQESWKLKIIDFGIATELVRENSQLMNLDSPEGCLDYISPEQTGRMNRPIDYRTDIYSLGVTLYELFCGQKPFSWNDEAEIVYSHIAKIPDSPSLVNSEIPDIISDIILKLISKNAEDRYQTAKGLQYDLENCIEMLQGAGEIKSFSLGKNDFSNKFQIPDKLYGREKEVQELMHVLNDISKGSTALVMVEGYPGIGKSRLINELSKFIAERHGFFISGKFDQLEKNIPLYAFIQALKGLIHNLLSESEKSIGQWKERILQAIPQNGSIIAEIIPEIEKIIGKQPPAIELHPIEAQNRFLITFREFVKIFATKDTPLIVFLDDLQWSDISSLDMLKYLLIKSKMPYVQFICAYRKNEFDSNKTLQLILEEIRDNFKNIYQLKLHSLSKKDINLMLYDVFHSYSKQTEVLTDIIYKKTKGNPFFINKFLILLYQQGLFRFDISNEKWEWDLKKIDEVIVSDNVVDLVIRNIELLPETTLEILKLASCIGSIFEIKFLSQILNQSTIKTGKSLWLAIENEIIFPLSHNYKLITLIKQEISLSSVGIKFSFQHDRIQQVIYSMISEKEKEKMHLDIGRELLKNYKKNKDSDYIFDLINHFNAGIKLVGEEKERFKIMNLNFLAGKKSMQSASFANAVLYFEISQKLLSEEEWKGNSQQRFELLLNKAESVFLSGDFQKAEDLCEKLFELSKGNIQKSHVYNLKTQIFEFQARFPEAVDEIRKGLQLFDIILPSDPQQINGKIGEEIMKMQKRIAKSPVADILKLPVMTDENMIMAMRLFYQLMAPALQSNPPLYVLSSLMMLELTMIHGVTSYSCKCLIDCGGIQAGSIEDYDTAYRFGETSFALINKLKADSLKPAVYFGFTFISCWKKHYQECLDYYDMAYKIGLEIGDIQHAAYAYIHKFHIFLLTGRNLYKCRKEIIAAISFLEEIKASMPQLLGKILLYIIRKYLATPERGDQNPFAEKDIEMIKAIESSKNLAYLYRFFQYNAIFNFIHDDLAGAEKDNNMAGKLLFAAQSDFPIADHYLIQSLILTKKWNQLEPEEQLKNLEVITVNQEKLKKWSDNCPENFLHKYYYLSAELAVLQKEPLENIIELYNKALSSIGEHDFIHMKALVNESIAFFWINRDQETIGKAYLREAYMLYRYWGADRKVSLMEQKYPQSYFSDQNSNVKKSYGSRTGSSKYSTNSIDMASILKSTQAISSEIKIDKLLTNLIYTIIENSGAQQGSLLLINEADNELYVEAAKKLNSEKIEILQSLPFRESKNVCPDIIQYVLRTRENVVIADASVENNFSKSLYLKQNEIKSVLCMPVIYQNTLKGILYLENNLSDNVFTEERIRILNILSTQASISIDNAMLYENLEEKVKERTIQLKIANEKFKELSLLDPLTDLHNRRYVTEFVNDLSVNFIKNKISLLSKRNLRDISLENKVLGVFLIDLDFFKDVNDTYGHLAGDNVLVGIANILKNMIRIDDFIVRWGGEEFLIILNNTIPEYLNEFAKKVLDAVRQNPLKIYEDKFIHKTCSIGFSMMPINKNHPDFLDLDRTINISDYALYIAKENGRDRAVYIETAEKEKISDECKNYIVKLTKNVEVNEKYINVQIIK